MIKNVLTILSGNTVSQAINVLTIGFVVVTYYSPEDFGRYAVCISIIGIISIIACLRYELAIVLVKGEIQANNLMAGSIFLAVITAIISYPVLFAVKHYWGHVVDIDVPVLLLSFLILLNSLTQIITYFLCRVERYRALSLSKLTQAIVLSCSMFYAGVRGYRVNGLLLATMLGYMAFSVYGIFSLRSHLNIRCIQYVRVASVFKRNLDFALYNMPNAFIDNIYSNGINFILIALTNPIFVGYYNYFHRILKAPLSLIFGAISQVIYRFFAKNIGNHKILRRALRRTFFVVLLILSFTLFIVFMFDTYFYNFPLPDSWLGLKEYIYIFLPWFVSPFIFSPFSITMVVFDKQKMFFIVSSIYNITILFILSIFLYYGFYKEVFFSLGMISIIYYLSLVKVVFNNVENEKYA